MPRQFQASSDFRTLFEGAPNLYLVLDPHLNIVAASDAYCKATMTTRDKILGRGIFDVFPDNPKDHAADGVNNLHTSLKRVLQFKRPDAMALQRYDIPSPDGGNFEERFWSPLNTPVLDDAGEVSWIIHCVEDATAYAHLRQQGERSNRLHEEQLLTISKLREANNALAVREAENAKLQQKLLARTMELQAEISERKKTESALKRESEFHDIVVNNIPAMVFVKDAVDLRFVLFNRAGEELLGIDRSEYLGKTDHDFFPKEQADHFVARDREALLSGGLHITPEETINTRYRGKRLLRTFKIVVPDEHGQPKYLLALSGDITEQKQAESALRESEARLRFLDTLGKETAKSVNADEILAKTTKMLGQYLNVAICAYADMEPDQDHFTIRGDWCAKGSSTIVGYYSLAEFGKLAVKKLGSGVPLVVNDNSIELDKAAAATFQSIGISATVCVPLVKIGRLTALMAVHSREPRIWKPNEIALLREVTERSWAHIERVRA